MTVISSLLVNLGVDPAGVGSGMDSAVGQIEASLTNLTQVTDGGMSSVVASIEGGLATAAVAAESSMADVAQAIDDGAVTAAQEAASGFDSIVDSAGDLTSNMAGASSSLRGISQGLDLVGLDQYADGLQSAAQGMKFFKGLGQGVSMVLQSQVAQTVAAKAATAGKVAADAAATAAAKTMAAAQWLVNAAMSANPIALVVLAIIALVAIFIVAYKKSETFRDIVNGALGVVKATAESVVRFFTDKVPAAFKVVTGAAQDVVGWVKKNWPLLLAILTGPIGLAVLAITKNWDTIQEGAGAVKRFVTGKFDDLVTFVTGLPGRLKTAASGLFDGIKTAFQSAVNWIIEKWNGLEFKIPGFDPPGPGPSFDGFTLSVPNIPLLARGGPVVGGGSYIVGEKGPELFTPTTSGYVHRNSFLDDLGRQLAKQFDTSREGAAEVPVSPPPRPEDLLLALQSINLDVTIGADRRTKARWYIDGRHAAGEMA